MQDLTQGAISRHLLRLSLPIALGMVFQTLYYLIDLYFVAALGEDAVAGVSAAGNLQFIVIALTQILAVGSMALIAQACGRKDHQDAVWIFNQSLSLALLLGLLTLGLGFGLGPWYLRVLAADEAARVAGYSYLQGFIPAMALQFALAAMGAALRGTGVVAPTLIVQMLSVILNAILAPILIAGWLTGHPLGVFGAGLASTLAVLCATLVMLLYFVRNERYVRFDLSALAPRLQMWRRILSIGLPPGGEFALLFLYSALIYALLREHGAAAQAAFGIGTRVTQALLLPAMALAFACAPLAGQNMGAGELARVRQTLRLSLQWISGCCALLSLVCYWQADHLMAAFIQAGDDSALVLQYGREYLHVIAWGFIPTGLVFTCSGLFQALGNTWPALLSATLRLGLFSLLALFWWLPQQLATVWLWWFAIFAGATQAIFSLTLIRWELQRRAPLLKLKH